MPNLTVFNSPMSLSYFLERIEKKTQERYEGYSYFGAPEKQLYNTYVLHFSIDAGYDANNEAHRNALGTWLKNKLKRPKVNFIQLGIEIDPESTSPIDQNNMVHIKFLYDLTKEEESSLMRLPVIKESEQESLDDECLETINISYGMS